MTAIYTAIFGGYDKPKPVPADGDTYVLITDDPHIDAPGWKVRVHDTWWAKTPMLRAKWWKTHPHRVFPFEPLSVWIDGSLVPHAGFGANCDMAIDGVDVAFTPHPLRDCIYTELEASVPLPKYDPDMMTLQVDHYRDTGHPEHWGLFATGAMTRRHTEPVINAMNEWWGENLEWSWQDQLSLPYVMRNHPEVSWKTSMPWATWWGYEEHG